MKEKTDLIRMKGEVQTMLSNARFGVKLENGLTIVAYVGGKMRQNRIRVTLHDRVLTELSTYDLARGRIVYRYRRYKRASNRARTKTGLVSKNRFKT